MFVWPSAGCSISSSSGPSSVTVLGSAEHLLHGLIPAFQVWPLIGGWGLYRVSQDLFSWLVLVGVGMAVLSNAPSAAPRLSFILDGISSSA